MHYPYNPGAQNPSFVSASANTCSKGNGDAARPVQNTVPVQDPPESPHFPLVEPIDFTSPKQSFTSSVMPVVSPEPPHFSVPSNPLLPGEYKEVLTYESLQYMNGFLRTQIGKECLVTMTVGAGGGLLSRLGYLVGVGINYLLLQDACSDEILVCDFYCVKLVQLMGKRCPVNLNIR